LMIADGSSILPWWAAAKSKAEPFALQVEKVSSQEVDFLDLHIFKGDKFRNEGKFDFKATRKQTAIGTPLLPTSLHHASTHLAWPSAVVRRVSSLCSSSLLARQVIQDNIDKWNTMGVVYQEQVPRRVHTTPVQTRVIRLALPCYWKSAKLGDLYEYLEGAWSAAGGIPMKFGPAWKLGGRPLLYQVRRYYLEYLEAAIHDPVLTERRGGVQGMVGGSHIHTYG
jgi:hypothetical protein